MTDVELIQNCVKDLGAINCPIEYFEQVSIPIYNVRNNLILLLKAVAERKAEEEKAKEPEIMISPVPPEEVTEDEQPDSPE